MNAPLGLMVVLTLCFAARATGAAEAPVGQWKTIDEKSGAVQSRQDL